SQVFPYAALVVHQGGIGTTGQGLRAGCPALVMPYSHDQPDNADRLVRLGVARTISRRNYTPDRAAAELNILLTDSRYKDCALDAGRRIQRENGAVAAADALERLLRGSPSSFAESPQLENRALTRS